MRTEPVNRNRAGSPAERRAAIFEGMDQLLDQVIEQHPHIVYALGQQTPEIKEAIEHLTQAINRFIRGEYTLRKEVRPYFDRAISAYLELADEIVKAFRRILAQELDTLVKDYPELELTLSNPEIQEATTSFNKELDRLHKGEGNTREVARSFYVMIAAYLAASIPDDIPIET
jgi:hypothetical protein